MRSSIKAVDLATVAVRSARVVIASGAVVRSWYVSASGRSYYLKCSIRGLRFTVRVSDHRGRNTGHRPYYFIRLDRPSLAGISGLHRFVSGLSVSTLAV